MSVVLFCYILDAMLCYVMCEKKKNVDNKKDYLQQNSNAFYGRQFREPRRGGHSDFAMTIWRF